MTEQGHDFVDTSDPDVRKQRAHNQYKYEQTMDVRLRGMSLVDRFFDIRDHIFGPLGNVKGSKPAEWIRNHPIPGHPNPEKILKDLLPKLYQFIDRTDELLSQMDDKGKLEEMGFRLSVVVYLMNVAIHPSTDGNGQTSRLLALSYIHEHCPNYKDKFFPLKWGENFEESDVDSALMTPRAVTKNMRTPDPENITLEDKDLLERMRKLSKERHRLEEKFNDDGFTTEMNNSELARAIDELNLAEFITNLDAEPYLHAFQILRSLPAKLREKYPGYEFSVFGQDSEQSTRNLLLDFLLQTDEGLLLLANYIEKGLDGVLPRQDDDRATRTLMLLNHFETGFKQILESKAVHDQKYQESLDRTV